MELEDLAPNSLQVSRTSMHQERWYCLAECEVQCLVKDIYGWLSWRIVNLSLKLFPQFWSKVADGSKLTFPQKIREGYLPSNVGTLLTNTWKKHSKEEYLFCINQMILGISLGVSLEDRIFCSHTECLQSPRDQEFLGKIFKKTNQICGLGR